MEYGDKVEIVEDFCYVSSDYGLSFSGFGRTVVTDIFECQLECPSNPAQVLILPSFMQGGIAVSPRLYALSARYGYQGDSG